MPVINLIVWNYRVNMISGTVLMRVHTDWILGAMIIQSQDIDS